MDSEDTQRALSNQDAEITCHVLAALAHSVNTLVKRLNQSTGLEGTSSGDDATTSGNSYACDPDQYNGDLHKCPSSCSAGYFHSTYSPLAVWLLHHWAVAWAGSGLCLGGLCFFTLSGFLTFSCSVSLRLVLQETFLDKKLAKQAPQTQPRRPYACSSHPPHRLALSFGCRQSLRVDSVLGSSWLVTHNPQIDWTSGTITTCSVTCHACNLLPPMLLDPTSHFLSVDLSWVVDLSGVDLSRVPPVYKD